MASYADERLTSANNSEAVEVVIGGRAQTSNLFLVLGATSLLTKLTAIWQMARLWPEDATTMTAALSVSG